MPVNIHGKEYFTVAERLKMARETDYTPPVGIHAIVTEPKQMGALTVMVATITFDDGNIYTGCSLVNTSATSPAERDAPLETAETSAVGRALAFAGYYGSPDGIAGAEELELARQRSEARASAPVRQFPDGSSSVTRMAAGGSASPRPVGNPEGPSPAQVRYANQLWERTGNPMPPPEWEQMTRRDVSAEIDKMAAETGAAPGRRG